LASYDTWLHVFVCYCSPCHNTWLLSRRHLFFQIITQPKSWSPFIMSYWFGVGESNRCTKIFRGFFLSDRILCARHLPNFPFETSLTFLRKTSPHSMVSIKFAFALTMNTVRVSEIVNNTLHIFHYKIVSRIELTIPLYISMSQ
jgi:hypothetical protein